jgi:hypothetical protein
VVIVLENKSYTTVAANYAYIPYLQTFEANGMRFANYREGDATGPSLPDYLELAGGSTCGATTDDVSAGLFDGQVCATTIWNQLTEADRSWAVYMDAMPSACSGDPFYANTSLAEPYVLKHNPATPFSSIWKTDHTFCQEHVLPGTPDPANLADVTYAIPGLCDDLHGSMNPNWTNCAPGSPELYGRANVWLTSVVPPLLDAGATVLITFDEAGILYAVADGPGIDAGICDFGLYTHYSVLASLEDAYSLPRLNAAADAMPLPFDGSSATACPSPSPSVTPVLAPGQ